jgi:hypothetical protein
LTEVSLESSSEAYLALTSFSSIEVTVSVSTLSISSGVEVIDDCFSTSFLEELSEFELSSLLMATRAEVADD